MSQKKSVVLVFKSDGMGTTAAQPLREALARKFLSLIVDADPCPARSASTPMALNWFAKGRRSWLSYKAWRASGCTW